MQLTTIILDKHLFLYFCADALGFLYFEENGESFDGNQGIKDQQLALQWVHDNIEKFGGNKDEVKIFSSN